MLPLHAFPISLDSLYKMQTEKFQRALLCKSIYSWFLLFTVLFYKVAANTEASAPRRNNEFCSYEPWVTRLLFINQHKNLVLRALLLKDTLFRTLLIHEHWTCSHNIVTPACTSLSHPWIFSEGPVQPSCTTQHFSSELWAIWNGKVTKKSTKLWKRWHQIDCKKETSL